MSNSNHNSVVTGLLLGTKAPVMTPNNLDFSFLSVITMK